MGKTDSTEKFWQAAKQSNVDLGDDYWVRRIGANKPTVDSILKLVLDGEKCGTFGLRWIQDRQPENTPKVGSDAVVVDMDDVPHAVVRTTRLTEVAYQDITEEHLVIEGPGARKLDRWQDIHWPYWTVLLKPYDLEPSEDMPVMVERFDLMYPQ